MTKGQIAAAYGEVNELVASTSGRARARVTDDTDQALIVARLLVEGKGRVDPRRLGEELLGWRQRLVERGEEAVLGPSTRRALVALAAGAPPEQTGRHGTTNGAAMRIPPVGIAVPPRPLERLVDVVVEADRVTHDTALAHAGAAAVAAAVSAGIDGSDVGAALELGIDAADAAARRGHGPDGDVPGGRRAAVTDRGTLDVLLDRLGTGVATEESVPAAFAIAARHPGDPWAACLTAANAGGDTDTVAAIAGAIIGSCTGMGSLPREAVDAVRRTNDLALEPLAADLLALRDTGR